jgi:hypothetical protein
MLQPVESSMHLLGPLVACDLPFDRRSRLPLVQAFVPTTGCRVLGGVIWRHWTVMATARKQVRVPSLGMGYGSHPPPHQGCSQGRRVCTPPCVSPLPPSLRNSMQEGVVQVVQRHGDRSSETRSQSFMISERGWPMPPAAPAMATLKPCHTVRHTVTLPWPNSTNGRDMGHPDGSMVEVLARESTGRGKVRHESCRRENGSVGENSGCSIHW